jgi:hypothetical protein
MRLGEVLVRDGLVTAEQVEAALSRQALHGARFGSNLVELSAVSMEDLAKALGRQHHMPAALEAHYDKIDPNLTKLLTPDLAASWHAVPLGRTGPDSSLVAIATSQPFDSDVRLELREIFDAEIVEAIAPEMRLYYWLEQVYGIDRLNRFKRIARRPSIPPAVDSQDQAGARETTAESVDVDVASLQEIEDAVTLKRVYVQTLSDTETVVPAGQLARIAVKRIAVPLSGEVEIPLDLSDWKACIRAIRQSKGRDSIAKVVTHVLQQGFDGQLAAGILLMAKEDIALGWRGFARGNNDIDVDALAVGLDAASMLAKPYATREPFFGKPEDPSVIDKRFWHFLGSEPAEVAVLPIVVLGEVACLLYVQSEELIPADKIGSLGDVARAISAALTRLIRAANR